MMVDLLKHTGTTNCSRDSLKMVLNTSDVVLETGLGLGLETIICGLGLVTGSTVFGL